MWLFTYQYIDIQFNIMYILSFNIRSTNNLIFFWNTSTISLWMHVVLMLEARILKRVTLDRIGNQESYLISSIRGKLVGIIGLVKHNLKILGSRYNVPLQVWGLNHRSVNSWINQCIGIKPQEAQSGVINLKHWKRRITVCTYSPVCTVYSLLCTVYS